MHDHSVHSGGSAALSAGAWLVPILFIAAGGLYLYLANQQRQRRKPWSRWRDASFIAGIILLAVAVTPNVSRLAHEDIRVHMVQHVSIGMVAPVGLALGAPASLLLRSVSVDTGRTIATILRWRPVHLLSHPVSALVLNVGGMYLLYLTPLFARSMDHPPLHHLVNLHFLAAGYLFVWSVAGPDPAPGRPSFPARVAVLVLSLGLHAFLGKLMYAHTYPRDVPFDPEQIREAAIIMYYGGDIAELLLAVALFATWYHHRQRKRLGCRLSRSAHASALP